MTELECSLCGALSYAEEGEPISSTCSTCLYILDRENFLQDYEYGSGDFPEEL